MLGTRVVAQLHPAGDVAKLVPKYQGALTRWKEADAHFAMLKDQAAVLRWTRSTAWAALFRRPSSG
jgi:hypothetical protein